jgi:hypothetical protein
MVSLYKNAGRQAIQLNGIARKKYNPKTRVIKRVTQVKILRTSGSKWNAAMATM